MPRISTKENQWIQLNLSREMDLCFLFFQNFRNCPNISCNECREWNSCHLSFFLSFFYEYINIIFFLLSTVHFTSIFISIILPIYALLHTSSLTSYYYIVVVVSNIIKF